MASHMAIFQTGVARALFLRWWHCLTHILHFKPTHRMCTYCEGVSVGPFMITKRYMNISCSCGKLFYGRPWSEVTSWMTDALPPDNKTR